MLRQREIRAIKLFATLAAVLSVCSLARGAVDATVSQKGRMFNPLSIDIAKGAGMIIINDDGDLLHHAYIESDEFNFDSGDQKPGSHTRIVFPVVGDFKVLCGIHPKMKLMVHVH